LKLEGAAAAVGKGEPLDARRAGGPAASILVVDDYPANLVAVEAVLAPLGHQVVRAGTGEEALKAVLRQDFAVIILDVQMPGLDGFQTATLIKTRERSSHIPIIFLTAINKDVAHVFRGYEHGAVDYLLKPFDPIILRRKVQVLVELWQRGERLRLREAALARQERARLAEASEARHQRLIESMPQCVLAMRPDGELYYCNQVWTRFSGLAALETGARLWDVVHVDERETLRAAWHEALANERPLSAEVRLVRASDGEPRWHLVQLLPQHEADELRGWIVSGTDIDDDRRARAAVEQASRAKDEFLATLSHELRNPLNAILGWSRMLRAGTLDAAQAARATETIERNAEMQAALIEDMLDVSRIITGKLVLDVEPVDLRALLLAAFETVRMAAEARQIDVQLVVDDDVPAAAGDPGRLQQVAWNLLSNAIKFTPRGGRVEARMQRRGAQIELAVSDSGQGIAADFLPHVFERFRQADSSSTRGHGGLGLGLAIVRHLVELHGGSVAVASEGEGLGATFTVRLPLRSSAPAAAGDADRDHNAALPRSADQRSASAGAGELSGLHALIVDDEADARELLAAVLEHHGATVSRAASADEALDLVGRGRPHVIVSDIAMPGIDGYELMRRVRALDETHGGATPAAALTGFARPEDGRRATDSGFDAHLAKPVDATQLVRTVRQLACQRVHLRYAAS
jgi:PAS domain S-box-containing protein